MEKVILSAKVQEWLKENKNLTVDDLEVVRSPYCEDCIICDYCDKSYDDKPCNGLDIFVIKKDEDTTIREHKGKFLQFKSKDKYEFISRTHSKPKKSDAVTIFAKDSVTDKWMCVIEKRIPIMDHSESDGYILSLPAGLIDFDDTAEESAIREFDEETGYTLDVKKVCRYAYSSSGMTDETTNNVYGYFNSDEEATQKLQGNEDITVCMVKDASEMYEIAEQNGYSLSNKIIQHFETLELGL